MSHPLDGAFARVNRAREHLRDLEIAVRTFCQDNDKSIEIRPISGTGIEVSHPHVDVPAIFSILIGEITYNLRAALDYLVYGLAERDSGEPQEGTQFPIEKSPQAFARRQDLRRGSGVFLRGLNARHIAAIELLQPYKGCDWTKTLRDISNPDKHRHLTITQVRIGLSARIEIKGIDEAQAFVNPFPDAEGSTKLTVGDEVMYVKHDAASHVAFADWTPVIETLQQLEASVTSTLDAFKSEF